MRTLPTLIAFAACASAPTLAPAQVAVPFFSGAGTAFEPEISVVNSGEVLDAQAVVSNDRKYVTLNMRASSSRLLALRQFDLATAGKNQLMGFVGGAGAAGNAGTGVNASPAASARENPLDRQGTSLVAGLDD
jgi:hypothetical protein